MSTQKFISSSVGNKLRNIRKQKGIKSANLLSELMGHAYSPSGILRREEGNLKIDFKYLEAFCTALKLEGKERENILTIAKLDLYRGNKSVLEITREFHALALRAQTVTSYAFAAIPNELQIYGYSKAIISRYGSYGDIEERTQLRQDFAKKNLLDQKKQKRIIMSEVALYVPTGSSELMLEQLAYLKLQKTQVPNFEFRILPKDVFINKPITAEFSIYDNQYAFCEARTGMITSEDDAVIQELNSDFSEMWQKSLASDSQDIIIDKAIFYYQSLLSESKHLKP